MKHTLLSAGLTVLLAAVMLAVAAPAVAAQDYGDSTASVTASEVGVTSSADAPANDAFEDDGVSVDANSTVSLQLNPESGIGAPGDEATFLLQVENLDGQFNDSNQVRSVTARFGIDTDVAEFNKSGVNLRHPDAINDGFTEILVQENRSELQLDITYNDGEYRPGNGSAGVINVADITVDMQNVGTGTSTNITFLESFVTDQNVDIYPDVTRNSTLTAGNPSSIDISFEHANGTGLAPGEPQRYELVIEGAENGIAGYDIDIQIQDTGIASFADFEETTEESTNSAIESGGSVLNLTADLTLPIGSAEELVLADVWVEANPDALPAPGTLSVEPWDLTTTDVSVEGDTGPYQDGDTGIATQEVAWADLNGNNKPAQDVTGDGLLDDTFGNGDVALPDALLLFDNRNELGTSALAPYFNFAEDQPPEVKLADALVLFDERFDRDSS
jgi:hypothetical protein